MTAGSPAGACSRTGSQPPLGSSGCGAALAGSGLVQVIAGATWTVNPALQSGTAPAVTVPSLVNEGLRCPPPTVSRVVWHVCGTAAARAFAPRRAHPDNFTALTTLLSAISAIPEISPPGEGACSGSRTVSDQGGCPPGRADVPVGAGQCRRVTPRVGWDLYRTCTHRRRWCPGSMGSGTVGPDVMVVSLSWPGDRLTGRRFLDAPCAVGVRRSRSCPLVARMLRWGRSSSES
jgi:hypothetical protein